MPSEKTLKTIVIVLGVLLVLGFMVLIGIVIFRATKPGGSEEKQADSAPGLTLPRDKTPVGMTQNTAVTILKVKTPDGEIEELVFDAETGEYLGKLVRED